MNLSRHTATRNLAGALVERKQSRERNFELLMQVQRIGEADALRDGLVIV
jgi:hypothetical protein